MRRYILRRLLLAIPLLLGVATLLFVLMEAVPGDYADLFLTPGMTAEVRLQIRENLGLDEPVAVRYLRYLGAMAQGDLGYSFSQQIPVRSALAQAVPSTLVLTGLALVLSFVLGILVGVIQAVRADSWLDRGLNLGVVTLYSVPSFWLGLVLLLVFSYLAGDRWGWPIYFPLSGMSGVEAYAMSAGGRFLDRLWHMALPLATLVLVLAPGVARYARTSMLEVLGRDYVRAARARGLPEWRVLWRHALPNALLPLITVLGLYIPVLFSGAIFVEEVFAWPGMGRLMATAVLERDIPVVMAGSILFAALVIVGNLVADVLYAWVDPRVRHG